MKRSDVSYKGEVPDLFGSKRTVSQTGTLIVTDLLEDVSDYQIRSLFEPYGRIQQVKVPRVKDKKTGEWWGRGIAFVTFWKKEDAETALKEVDGALFHHTRIRVKWSSRR